MLSRRFWLEAAERAVKSTAQALLGLWALDQFDALSADWRTAAGVALGAAVLSLLSSVASAPWGDDGPSLV